MGKLRRLRGEVRAWHGVMRERRETEVEGLKAEHGDFCFGLEKFVLVGIAGEWETEPEVS